MPYHRPFAPHELDELPEDLRGRIQATLDDTDYGALKRKYNILLREYHTVLDQLSAIKRINGE